MNTSAESAMASNRFSDGHDNGHDTSAASATQLRHDIERTRAQMSGTIDALQAKLTPPQLLASGRDALWRLAANHTSQKRRDSIT